MAPPLTEIHYSDVNKDLTFKAKAKDLTAFTVEYVIGLYTFNVIHFKKYHKMSLLSLCLNRSITNNFQSALKSTLTKLEDIGIALQIDKCFMQRVTHARTMWTHH